MCMILVVVVVFFFFFFFDFVYMKLCVVRSWYLCVMCQTLECRPNKGAPRFFFFFEKNVRCVYQKGIDDAFKGE